MDTAAAAASVSDAALNRRCPGDILDEAGVWAGERSSEGDVGVSSARFEAEARFAPFSFDAVVGSEGGVSVL
eukprot:11222283-Lingulodinium_polyedra.AAC.1